MPSPDESRHVRGRAWLRRAAVVLLMALTGIGAVYAALPWLAAVLAPRLAGPLGLDELQVSMGRPGWKGVDVGSVVLASGRVHLNAREGRITYRPGALLDGRLARVEFREVTVRMSEGAAAGAADSAPPSIEALFAALPAEQVFVDDLELHLPALDFRAAGALALSGQRLDVHLEGLSPVEAERFGLSAQVSADGTVGLRLGERDAEQPPFVVVTSRISGDRVVLDGEMDIRGFALNLVAAFAGLPTGQGRIAGTMTASVPWPLPDRSELDRMAAGGVLKVDWQSRTAPWQLSGFTVDWRLEAGELHGEGAGMVSYGDRRFRLDADLVSFRPGGPAGNGSVVLTLPDADTPFLDADWVLAPDALTLAGRYRLPPPQIQWLAGALDLPLGEGSLAGELSTRLPWPLPERWQELRPPSRASVSGEWRRGAVELSRLQGNWRLEAGRLSGSLEGLVGYHGDLEVAAGVEIDRLTISDHTVALEGTGALGKAVRLPFSGSYRLDTGTGSLSAHGDVAVDGPLAEGLVQGWSEPYDLTGAQLVVGADLDWSSGGGPYGTVTLEMAQGAARYRDYTMSGLSGTLAFSAPREGAWSLAPSALRLDRVNTGIELRDVHTAVAWAGSTVTVQATTARVLGGTARVAAFAYDMDAGEADFVVDLEDLELARVLALEGEHVSGTGIVDGTLPVHLRDNVPAIEAGRVRSEPPGGTIRVSSALAGGTGQPGLDFALRALQDFRYSVLEADVAYSGDGDLTLGVHLEGRNPEIEGGRPIHYNVTVNENVPTLLKSLRLQDELTRQIERRVTD